MGRSDRERSASRQGSGTPSGHTQKSGGRECAQLLWEHHIVHTDKWSSGSAIHA